MFTKLKLFTAGLSLLLIGATGVAQAEWLVNPYSGASGNEGSCAGIYYMETWSWGDEVFDIPAMEHGDNVTVTSQYTDHDSVLRNGATLSFACRSGVVSIG